MGAVINFRRTFRNYPFWDQIRAHKKLYFWGLLSLVFVDAINVALPVLVKIAIDAIPGKHLSQVYWAAGLYFGLMALQAVGRYLWRVLLMGASHRIARELRLNLYSHLQSLPLDYYQRVRTGDLMSRATNDIESIRMAVGPGVLVTVDAAMMFLLIVPVMFALSWKLSILAFAFYPVVPWLTAKIGDRIDSLFEDLQRRMSDMGAFIQESFAAIRLIKSLVLESKTRAKFVAVSEAYRQQGVLQAKYQAVFSPALGLLTNLGTFLILLLGGLDVMEGLITVGTFVAFQRFVVQLSWPMEAIGWAVTMNREGVAAHRRLQEILTLPGVESTRGNAVGQVSDKTLLKITRLRYAYPESARLAVDLEDLEVPPGAKVGIVGPVGSGKSTFFQLVLRLYEPQASSIYFRGKDVVALPLDELRRRIGSVEQQIFLFSERIDANIAMGMSGDAPAVDGVTEVANIRDEILVLEKGFATTLGERGVNLSGGQKQRIALARALARSPELLLLDDCFSAVDVAVESHIIERFFSSYPDLAVCFATHRLSIMPRMDEIWLFREGGVVDRGPHHALLERSPLYQSLWQKSERSIEVERFESKVLETEGTA